MEVAPLFELKAAAFLRTTLIYMLRWFLHLTSRFLLGVVVSQDRIFRQGKWDYELTAARLTSEIMRHLSSLHSFCGIIPFCLLKSWIFKNRSRMHALPKLHIETSANRYPHESSWEFSRNTHLLRCLKSRIHLKMPEPPHDLVSSRDPRKTLTVGTSFFQVPHALMLWHSNQPGMAIN